VPADGPWPKKRRAGLRMRSGPRNSWAVLGSGVAVGPLPRLLQCPPKSARRSSATCRP
jgi:hypothetical protein